MARRHTKENIRSRETLRGGRKPTKANSMTLSGAEASNQAITQSINFIERGLKLLYVANIPSKFKDLIFPRALAVFVKIQVNILTAYCIE